MLNLIKKTALLSLVTVALGNSSLSHAGSPAYADFYCANPNDEADTKFVASRPIPGTRDITREATSWLLKSGLGSFINEMGPLSLKGEEMKLDAFTGSVFLLSQLDRQGQPIPLAFPGTGNLPTQSAEDFCVGLVKICTDTVSASHTNVKVLNPITYEYIPIAVMQNNALHSCPGSYARRKSEEASSATLYCEGQDHQYHKAAIPWDNDAQWLEKDFIGKRDDGGNVALWGRNGSTFTLYQKTADNFLEPLSFPRKGDWTNQTADGYCKQLVTLCTAKYGNNFSYVAVGGSNLDRAPSWYGLGDPTGDYLGLKPVSVMDDHQQPYLCPNYGAQLVKGEYNDNVDDSEGEYKVKCRDHRKDTIFEYEFDVWRINGKTIFDTEHLYLDDRSMQEAADSLIGHPWCANTSLVNPP